MEPIPNIQDTLSEQKLYIKGKGFRKYSPAFVVSNENLRIAMQYMPRNCDNALTVAASGDHPLFCKLFGAKHITTFDISYNAKIITDIKTAALQELNITEYRNLLYDLYDSHSVLSVTNIDKILHHLTKTEQNYLCSTDGYRLFYNGLPPLYYIDYGLQDKEYEKLKKSIHKPFEFIWSNVTKLHTRLDNQQYDFIHLSNIVDYLENDDIASVLNSMIPRLRINGVMFIEADKVDFSGCLRKYTNNKSLDIFSQGSINVLTRTR